MKAKTVRLGPINVYKRYTVGCCRCFKFKYRCYFGIRVWHCGASESRKSRAPEVIPLAFNLIEAEGARPEHD